MADELRRRIMRANGPRDTKPEIDLRKRLHRRGLRYRIADRRLPGSPDIVFPSRRTVLFVNGCYWHHHPGCHRATLPKTNTEFWRNKFETNRLRDRRNVTTLLGLGWRVGIFWECCDVKLSEEEVANFVCSTIPAYAEWPDPILRDGHGLFDVNEGSTLSSLSSQDKNS